MPPKARNPSVSSSSGRSFNITSFFDAASAGRRGAQRPSGHGFRIDPPSLSQARADGTISSSQPQLSGGVPYHWSSGLASAEVGDSSAEAGYSNTMETVRQRILDELRAETQPEGGKSSSAGSSRGPPSAATSGKLQQHRKRAMTIAFGGEDDLMVSAVEFSLTCPYSRLPLHVPVRSRLCNHVQCCDLDSWMVLMDKHKSLRDPKGPCPVCELRVAASTLEVDVWMLHVLQQMPSGTHLVVLEADGSYHSGDTTREKRRDEVAMEVIDATQGDFENFLGDVIDDDDDVSASVRALSTEPSNVYTASAASGAKRSRDGPDAMATTTPTSTPHAAGDQRAALIARSEPAGPTIVVKQEASTVADATTPAPATTPPAEDGERPGDRLSSAPLTPATAGQGPSQLPPSTQDEGVVIVHFIEPTAHGRALPSRIREWVFYCPACHTPQLKGEAGLNESTTTTAQGTPHASPSPASSGSPLLSAPCASPASPPAGERCSHCGQTTRDEWSLVRRFGNTPSPISMELTADGTALLCGVDAAAPYLYRAGFTRTRFTPQEFQRPLPADFRPTVGLWVTTRLLSRFEVDFLEACCERIAAGETNLESLDGMMVPALFRIPRRRRTTGAGQSGFFVSQRS